MLDSLEVYTNRGLSSDIGLIFDKENNNLQISPLMVKFDNYENPRTLLVKEKLYAHYNQENSLIKLRFA